MSKRLQVLLDEKELREIQRIARRQRITVAEWVRQALRAAKRREPTGDASRKLEAIRSAARHAFPSDSVEDMIRDIDRGYAAGLDT
jgi:predicted 2-oxoglutarate/Fe(II)-dependent dioxygenase YbiX